MANNTDSNITAKVARVFSPAFESSRVLTKAVNTQLLNNQGLGEPQFGETMKFKRPHQYRTKKTSDGDITGTRNDIISGSSVGTVQNVYTVKTDYTAVEEAIRLDQLEEILRPAAEELVNQLEVDFGAFMINNSGLSYGTPGTVVNAWGDVAGAGALMESIGIPMAGERYYVMNPFTVQNLADAQNGLSSGSNNLVDTAWMKAQISKNFGGLQAITSNSLTSFQAGATTDRAGTLGATPDATYVTHKDTMIQTLVLNGLTASVTNAVRPGDIIEFTSRYHVNVKNRQTVIGVDGNPVKWRCTVVTGGNTDGSGNVTVTVTNAAINEGATGQYNNIDTALASGDAFTILGTQDVNYQPNLFFHKEAFGIGTVKLAKLHSTDTVFTTKDGMSVRISKYADGDANKNNIRFDLLPAFAAFNPLFAGKGWRVA